MPIVTCFVQKVNEKFEKVQSFKFLSQCNKNKLFPPQLQILLGYLLQIFLITTSEVFVMQILMER